MRAESEARADRDHRPCLPSRAVRGLWFVLAPFRLFVPQAVLTVWTGPGPSSATGLSQV